MPVPSGDKTREIYGNVINGKINADIVSTAFIIKFFLIEICFTFILSPHKYFNIISTINLSTNILNFTFSY
ncbi:hypothetical protein JCM35486_24790 [Blautia wexlerae]